MIMFIRINHDIISQKVEPHKGSSFFAMFTRTVMEKEEQRNNEKPNCKTRSAITKLLVISIRALFLFFFAMFTKAIMRNLQYTEVYYIMKKVFTKNFIEGFAYICGTEAAKIIVQELRGYLDDRYSTMASAGDEKAIRICIQRKIPFERKACLPTVNKIGF